MSIRVELRGEWKRRLPCGGRIVPRCMGGAVYGIRGCTCDLGAGGHVRERLTYALERPGHWLPQNDNGRRVSGPSR